MSMTPEPDQASRTAVRAAGDRTIEQYQDWMQTNGAAHLMRAARESGITGLLRQKQHTLDELCEALSLDPETAKLLIDGLVAIGFVEQYEDDFALARAGHLLCQYDDDLGDSRWETLVDRIKGSSKNGKVESSDYRDRLAATQWIHTAAAMQAAEILDIGGQDSASQDSASQDSASEDTPSGLRILDLGCGSAVWSCAMAHCDPESTIVAIDDAAAIKAAESTAESIGLGDRFKTIESDPRSVAVDGQAFDLVILAQVLSSYSDSEATELLDKAVGALRSGGRLVAPDFYVGPGRAGLKEALSRLSIHLATAQGRVRDLPESQQMFKAAGLTAIQFTYLAASEAGMGMIVGEKQ